jgi:hypothetical protein
LIGDRYAPGKGFYSGEAEWDAHVTLIQQEAFNDKLYQARKDGGNRVVV